MDINQFIEDEFDDEPETALVSGYYCVGSFDPYRPGEIIGHEGLGALRIERNGDIRDATDAEIGTPAPEEKVS